MPELEKFLSKLDEETLYQLTIVVNRRVRKIALRGMAADLDRLMILREILNDAHNEKLLKASEHKSLELDY